MRLHHLLLALQQPAPCPLDRSDGKRHLTSGHSPPRPASIGIDGFDRNQVADVIRNADSVGIRITASPNSVVLCPNFTTELPNGRMNLGLCAGAPQNSGKQMAKRTRETIPALVLSIVVQIYTLSEHRTQPWYVDRSALDMTEADDYSLTSAIYYAEEKGWLVSANEPRQSIAISPEGVRLLEERGLI